MIRPCLQYLPASPRRQSKVHPPAKRKPPPAKKPPPRHPPAQKRTTQTLPKRSQSEGAKLAHSNSMNGHARGGAGDLSLEAAMKKIKDEEWTEKVEGISAIQSIAYSNPKVISNDLNNVVSALSAESKNLRSGVSNKALECFGHFFMVFKKQMDVAVDKVTPVLINKTGDVSSAFIRENALKSVEMMVDHVTPSKSVPAIIASGANSKSEVIRSSTAQLLCRVCENLGPDLALNSVGDKLFPQIVTFAADKQPQPRYHGKMALQVLAADQKNFDRAVSKYCNGSQEKFVRELVHTVNSRGIGDRPQGSLHGPVSTSANGHVTNGRAGGTVKRTQSQKVGKVNQDVQITLEEILKNLSSNEWQNRSKGVEDFEAMVRDKPRLVSQNAKLFEAYIGRLSDINSKVALQALTSFQTVIPRLAPHCSDTPVRAMTGDALKTLMAQIPSKNEEIRHMALKGLDTCVKHMDNASLIGPFSMATRRGNSKQKPEMISRLGRLSLNIDGSKPKMVEMHSLPVLWELLKEKQGESALKKATQEFARILSKCMGRKNLVDSASTQLKPQLEALL